MGLLMKTALLWSSSTIINISHGGRGGALMLAALFMHCDNACLLSLALDPTGSDQFDSANDCSHNVVRVRGKEDHRPWCSLGPVRNPQPTGYAESGIHSFSCQQWKKLHGICINNLHAFAVLLHIISAVMSIHRDESRKKEMFALLIA